MKGTTITAAMIVVFAGATTAEARRPWGGHGGGPGMGKGHRMGRFLAGPKLLKIAKEIGLDSTQIERIKKLAFSMRRKAVATRAKLQLARIDLREAMAASTPPSERKVIALVEKMGRHKLEMKKNFVLMMLRVRKMMSAQQWEQLQLLRAEHKSKRHKKWGRHRGKR